MFRNTDEDALPFSIIVHACSINCSQCVKRICPNLITTKMKPTNLLPSKVSLVAESGIRTLIPTEDAEHRVTNDALATLTDVVLAQRSASTDSGRSNCTNIFTADLAREMEDRDLAPPEAKVSKVEVMTDVTFPYILGYLWNMLEVMNGQHLRMIMEEVAIGAGHMRIFLHYLDMAPSATSSASSAENYVNAIKEEEWFTTFSLYKISTEIWQEWKTSVKRLFTEQSTSFASTKTISTPSTTAPTRITNAGANVSQIYDNVSAGTSDVLFPVVSSSPYCVILYGRFVISNVLCVLFAVEYTVKRWTHTIVYFESKERRIIFCEIGDYKRRHGREIGSIPLECNFEQRKICLVEGSDLSELCTGARGRDCGEGTATLFGGTHAKNASRRFNPRSKGDICTNS